jgi:hypothetical protein
MIRQAILARKRMKDRKTIRFRVHLSVQHDVYVGWSIGKTREEGVRRAINLCAEASFAP